ncbi:MAG: hypothetical protein FWE11_01715 [Defluviitaleaceae bacterium]|nr:hypothetical protein [Defluviitaleaceae bacterium]
MRALPDIMNFIGKLFRQGTKSAVTAETESEERNVEAVGNVIAGLFAAIGLFIKLLLSS